MVPVGAWTAQRGSSVLAFPVPVPSCCFLFIGRTHLDRGSYDVLPEDVGQSLFMVLG